MFKKESLRKLIVVGLFALAMAFVETVVVVFLRMIYYPNGFAFPLNPKMESWVYLMEFVREIFTLVMLAAVGYLAGKKISEKFAYFIYAFAVWDIFYYLWLKVILDWPASLLDWDLLFLVPVAWIGPVLALVICSITFIFFCLVIIKLEDQNTKVKLNWKEGFLFLAGSLIIIYTWVIDYIRLSLENKLVGFVPVDYNWPLFILGEAVIGTAIAHFYWRYHSKKK